MCGIFGSVVRNHCSDTDWIKSVQRLLRHRGPDDSGLWLSPDRQVSLGHTRLAIVDLTPEGHQPMVDERSGNVVVFNGEIYNYKELRDELRGTGHSFASESDTEVLLAAYSAWGEDCLSRLNGMFAFALYDTYKGSIFFARDRAGEKPLFYTYQQGVGISFASELKALLAFSGVNARINRESLDCYLSMGYVPGERCIIDNCNKLPPAHAMKYCVNSGKLSVWKYWSIPELSHASERSAANDCVRDLEQLLEDSVAKQLVADVPVGILLSGGVDSSLITAMAARRMGRVNTFSIVFPGHLKHDESAHSRLVARHFGTQHTELEAQPTTADLLPVLAAQFDEPVIDSSMIPTWLVTNLVRKHCTVALGGDGGDELFGGYSHYSRLLKLDENCSRIPFLLRKALSKTATVLLPVGYKGRNWLMSLDTDLRTGLPLIASYFDKRNRRKLLPQYSLNDKTAEEIFWERVPKQGDLIERATRLDFANYMAEDILVKVDRASMLNSLEMRAPFLDYRVIEFAFRSVPSHLKANSRDRKIILKLLCERILPKEFDKKRKQGFGIPLDTWLKKGPFRDLFWSTLTSEDCIFDRRFIRNLLKSQDKRGGNAERLFGLVMLELWRRHYLVSF